MSEPVKHLLSILIASLAVWINANSFVFGADLSGRVIGPDGEGLAQAVVFVQELPDGVSVPSFAAMAQMDQINEQFSPSVLPIPVGTQVTFPNKDQIHHHVYSFSRAKRFEIPLYRGEDVPPVLFDKPGVVKVGCNIHDWMSGVILVVPTPFYAMTQEDGSFTLHDLPAATYPIVSWHERSKTKVDETLQQVKIDTDPRNVTFSLVLKASRSRPAIRGSRGYR